jgi:hypothetical protein
MRDVLFDDDRLSFSKLGIGWLLAFDARMQTIGYARNLRKAIRATHGEGEEEHMGEMLSEYRVIPDGYIIDRQNQTVYFFEIEDTNPISTDKLRKLSQIWFYLDCIQWDLKVFLIDRYLSNWRALPLSQIYFSLAHPDPRLSESVRKGAQTEVVVDWEATYSRACKAPINQPVLR